MQLLLDCIKHQHAHANYTRNRVVIGNIKKEPEALKEAVELIRTILSECIERNLPIDDAFAALHFAQLNKSEVYYKKIIDNSRNEKVLAVKQVGSKNSQSLLKKLQAEYVKK